MNKLSVGIIGLRHLHARGYISLFQQIAQAEVVSLADSDEALLKSVGQEENISSLYIDWRQLLKQDDIASVLILLPHIECPSADVAATAAGKHVIVEKPMASTSEGIRQIIVAAEKHSVKLSTPYVWRYEAAAREIKKMLSENAIGKVVACEGRNIAGPPSRYIENGVTWMIQKKLSGGGVLHNLGTHWIDMFRWLLEDEIVSVYGEINSLTHGLEIEDNAYAVLYFKGGATGMISASYSIAPGYDLYIQLRGTDGIITWYPHLEGPSDLVIQSNIPEYASAPIRNISFEAKKVNGYAGVWGLTFIQEFVQAILEDKEPSITGEDGLKNVQVVEAAYRSNESGKREAV